MMKIPNPKTSYESAYVNPKHISHVRLMESGTEVCVTMVDGFQYRFDSGLMNIDDFIAEVKYHKKMA